MNDQERPEEDRLEILIQELHAEIESRNKGTPNSIKKQKNLYLGGASRARLEVLLPLYGNYNTVVDVALDLLYQRDIGTQLGITEILERLQQYAETVFPQLAQTPVTVEYMWGASQVLSDPPEWMVIRCREGDGDLLKNAADDLGFNVYAQGKSYITLRLEEVAGEDD